MEPAVIHQEEDDIKQELADLGLNQAGLTQVVQEAFLAHNSCTRHHPANAPGTSAYQEGTRTLRDQFCPLGWIKDQTDSIESICNEKLGVKVVYQNVDIATDTYRTPKARSKKGAGTERAVEKNPQSCFSFLKDTLRSKPDSHSGDGVATWYLCAALNGSKVTAELSLPRSLKDGQFSDFIKRIFLITEKDWDDFSILDPEESKAEEDQNFDIKISRK